MYSEILSPPESASASSEEEPSDTESFSDSWESGNHSNVSVSSEEGMCMAVFNRLYYRDSLPFAVYRIRRPATRGLVLTLFPYYG